MTKEIQKSLDLPKLAVFLSFTVVYGGNKGG